MCYKCMLVKQKCVLGDMHISDPQKCVLRDVHISHLFDIDLLSNVISHILYVSSTSRDYLICHRKRTEICGNCDLGIFSKVMVYRAYDGSFQM